MQNKPNKMMKWGEKMKEHVLTIRSANVMTALKKRGT